MDPAPSKLSWALADWFWTQVWCSVPRCHGIGTRGTVWAAGAPETAQMQFNFSRGGKGLNAPGYRF